MSIEYFYINLIEFSKQSPKVIPVITPTSQRRKLKLKLRAVRKLPGEMGRSDGDRIHTQAISLFCLWALQSFLFLTTGFREELSLLIPSSLPSLTWVLFSV